ncbi:amidohydrolase family protein [Actinoallomurus acaciae]|uniref:Amidohydrolase family protein n=1 Tax=Actinoallomurus acaciae TaxID=502577 RepID=A0ABV5YYQ3_9ACTN
MIVDVHSHAFGCPDHFPGDLLAQAGRSRPGEVGLTVRWSEGLRGIKKMPMYAGSDPDDEAFDPLWRYASDEGLPVLLRTGTTCASQAPIEYARPMLADKVARRYPEPRMILAHLGHPYEGERIAVIRKHPNVHADVSALHYRPFQPWRALMLVQEYGERLIDRDALTLLGPAAGAER